MAKLIELHPEPPQIKIITVNKTRIKVPTSSKVLHPYFVKKAYQGAHKRVKDKMRKQAISKVTKVVKAMIVKNNDMETIVRKQLLDVKKKWESIITTADFKIEVRLHMSFFLLQTQLLPHLSTKT